MGWVFLGLNRFESSDVFPGTGDILIIEVKHKGEKKQFKAEEITLMVLSISDTVSLIDIFKEEKRPSERYSVIQRKKLGNLVLRI